MAQPIEIIIRQGGHGSGDKKDKKKKDKKKKEFDTATHYLLNALQSNVKSIINYSISNYGNMTGNYIGQAQINASLEIASTLGTIGLATAKYGAFGFIGATLTVGVNKGLQVFSHYIDVQKANTQASFMRERSGNSLNNGSAGTYE